MVVCEENHHIELGTGLKMPFSAGGGGWEGFESLGAIALLERGPHKPEVAGFAQSGVDLGWIGAGRAAAFLSRWPRSLGQW